ncbi:unnamed protein product [Polarella glacialis]|uniref:SET domain-containing protein n=1 Tax=Polarella glacialis TaxID=89957 RepID=A0A813KVE1_POLGL|nr:unnamed protein product [Polarella glacialis]
MTKDKTSQEDLEGQWSEDDLRAEVVRLRQELRDSREETLRLGRRVSELEAQASSSDALQITKLTCPGGEPDEQDKRRVLDHLRSEAYVHLAVSPIAGVGVFAFRTIPVGIDPFPICNPHMGSKERVAFCSRTELMGMPPGVCDLVKSFFAPLTEDDSWTPQTDENGEILYGVLATGMNSLNLSWYLNHSDNPNISFKDADDEGGFNSFVTNRQIEAGEELVNDYRELGKEFYALVIGGG